jgi:hypothetical protein
MVVAAAGAAVIGTILLLIGQTIGLVGMVAGYALLLAFRPTVGVAMIVASMPVATIGWGAPLATIDGRTLDARLVLTFGIAALAGGRALVDLLARRPDWLEVGMGAFLAYVVLIGLLQSESVYVWAPYAARWTSYFAIFVIARRAFSGESTVTLVAGAALGGFLLVTLGGLLEFALGAGRFMNEAVRATAPGDGGPVALAFAAQFVAITAFYVPTSDSRSARTVRWVVASIGGLAVVASATRTVLITAWAALAVPALIARHWRRLLIVTLFVGAGLVARPDFIGRFLDMVGVDPPPAPTDGGEVPPEGEGDERVDASLNFRLFVWGELLERWAEVPVVGIGPGMTAEAIAEVSPASRIPPHNDYVGVLSELGAIGLIGFVGLQLAVGWQLVLRQLSRLRRRVVDNDPRVLAATLFVAFNVLGALNNPMYYLDIQLAVWSIVGASLAVTSGGDAEARAGS